MARMRAGAGVVTISTAEVAEMFGGVHPKTVERTVRDGERFGVARAWVRVGRAVRWYPDEVRRYFDEVSECRSRSAATATGCGGTPSTEAEPAPSKVTATEKPRRMTPAGERHTAPAASTTRRLSARLRSLP